MAADISFRGKKYRQHVFITYAAGKDELGRDSSARAARINAALQQSGLVTKIDEDREKGDVTDKDHSSIDESAAVVVLVTKLYRDKVNGSDSKDKCRREFIYATISKGADLIIPVVMEPCMRKQDDWGGRLAMEIGALIYKDCYDDAAFEPNILQLAKAVRTTLDDSMMRRASSSLKRASARLLGKVTVTAPLLSSPVSLAALPALHVDSVSDRELVARIPHSNTKALIAYQITHQKSAAVQLGCLDLLLSLHFLDETPEGKAAKRDEIIAAGGAHAIVRAIQTHPGEERVVVDACYLVSELGQVCETRRDALMAAGAADALVNVIKRERHLPITGAMACRAVRVLAFSALASREALVAAGAAEAVVGFLKENIRDGHATQEACAAVRNLARSGGSNKIYAALMAAGAADGLVCALTMQLRHTGVVTEACWAISSLAGSEDRTRSLVTAGAAEAVLRALQVHQQDAAVASVAFGAIANMSGTSSVAGDRLWAAGAGTMIARLLEVYLSNYQVGEAIMRAWVNLTIRHPERGAALDAHFQTAIARLKAQGR
jgi:hypothetical protein